MFENPITVTWLYDNSRKEATMNTASGHYPNYEFPVDAERDPKCLKDLLGILDEDDWHITKLRLTSRSRCHVCGTVELIRNTDECLTLNVFPA